MDWEVIDLLTGESFVRCRTETQARALAALWQLWMRCGDTVYCS